jgi:endoglucanase
MKTRKLLMTVLGVAGTVALLPVDASAASGSKTLGPKTNFFVRAPDQAAVSQVEQLLLHGDGADALRVANMEVIPQAVWLDGGTPSAVETLVEKTLLEAKFEHTVPVFVPYNIPGRDCGGYSAGGAQTTADYEAWISAIAAAIGTREAVIVLEPDALANLPSDCGYDTTGQLTTDRYTQIAYAIGALEALPSTLVGRRHGGATGASRRRTDARLLPERLELPAHATTDRVWYLDRGVHLLRGPNGLEARSL